VKSSGIVAKTGLHIEYIPDSTKQPARKKVGVVPLIADANGTGDAANPNVDPINESKVNCALRTTFCKRSRENGAIVLKDATEDGGERDTEEENEDTEALNEHNALLRTIEFPPGLFKFMTSYDDPGLFALSLLKLSLNVDFDVHCGQ